jgi:DNA-binding LacI/PurR family transcriptional regulator
MAHHEQVPAVECILLTSGAAPLTAVGLLRWVRSLDGDRLAGSHLPAQDPAEKGAVTRAEHTEESGVHAARDLLGRTEHVTVVFVGNDRCAIGVLDTLLRRHSLP